MLAVLGSSVEPVVSRLSGTEMHPKSGSRAQVYRTNPEKRFEFDTKKWFEKDTKKKIRKTKNDPKCVRKF